LYLRVCWHNVTVYFDGHVFVTIIGRYVIKNAFPADQIGNGRSDYEI
jgi:hypothetical protein